MKWRTNILIIAVLFASICATIDGISVDCSYGMISFGLVGSVYTCTGRVLFDGSESVTAVYGNHQSGKGYEDVGGIDLPDQNLEFFPTNFESFFPNTIAINLYNNSITNVSNRHLIPFPNLEFLRLRQNKITSIDGFLFEGLNSMRFIQFSDNAIRHVGHDLNLPISGEIFFQVNPCIDQYAKTTNAIANLKFNLLRNCPPTISQIEDSLEQRQNLLAHIDGQVQTLIKNNKEMKDELATLQNEQVNQWHVMYDFNRRVEYLESIMGNAIEASATERIDTFGKND